MANDYFNVTQVPQPGTTVRSSQFNDNNQSIEQGFDALPSKQTLYSASQNFGIDTGVTANLYEVEIAPGVFTGYFDGMAIQVRASKANTGAAQVNLNGLGNRQIVTQNQTQLEAGDIVQDRQFVLRYNSTIAKFTIDVAESSINIAVGEATEARDFAQQWATEAEDVTVDDGVNPVGFSSYHYSRKSQDYANDADSSRIAAGFSAAAAATSETNAQLSVTASQNVLDALTGIYQLDPITWVQGQSSTDPYQRYEYNGFQYVAPDASIGTPVLLGASPVGDPNWQMWSNQIRFFSYTETLTTAKSLIDVGSSFAMLGDVFVDTNLQAESAYSFDGSAGTVTFSEVLPIGTYVKIWVGSSEDLIVADIKSKINNDMFVQWDYGTTGSTILIFRPNTDFVEATLFVNGIAKRPNVDFLVETDTNNSAYNQIRMLTGSIAAGNVVWATLRRAI